MMEQILYEKILMEALNQWRMTQASKASYSLTIDSSSLSRYKLSLYYYGEYMQVLSAYSISTNNIHELIHKLQNGVRENANNQ